MHNDTTPVPLTVAEMAARVETLLAGFDRVATPREAREGAEALVRTIVSLYGSGLERVLEIVHEASDDRSGAVFAKLVEDPFVESLLCLHGLHPVGLAERVQAALDSVRPYLKSHEGDVAIDGIDGDVVLLRLEGSCDGCPSSTATIELAVERAILERVPEIREVRALGLAPPLATTQSGRSLKIESDWIPLADLAGLGSALGSGVAARDIDETSVLFVRIDQTVFAYRNVCPTCTRPLDDARLVPPILTCAACGFAFDVVRAGRATDGVGSAEPFPLARENGRVRVAVPLLA